MRSGFREARPARRILRSSAGLLRGAAVGSISPSTRARYPHQSPACAQWSRPTRRFLDGWRRRFLTDALEYEPQTHTADNAHRAVERAFPGAHVAVAPSAARLQIPQDAKNHAQALLGNGALPRVFVGVHPSGGRLVKQWHTDRLADVATRLARDLSATVVLTGTPDDRALVDRITSLLPADVRHLDLTGKMDLPVLAAVLQQLKLFVTADTGPMHLAAAVGTPTVAIFGPSDPNRYGPLNDERGL